MAFNPDCPELVELNEFRKAFPPHTHERVLKAGHPPAPAPGAHMPSLPATSHVPVGQGSPTPSPFPPAPQSAVGPPAFVPCTPAELLRNGWQATTPERKAEIRREGAKILTNMSHAPRADVLAALERVYGLEP